MPIGIHYISTDHDYSVSECYRKLRQLGYRNIGYQNIEASEKRNRYLFYSAYLKCCALDGMPAAQPYYDVTLDSEKVIDWINCYNLDAVICTDESLKSALVDSSYKVPDGIGLAGLDFVSTKAKTMGFAAYVSDRNRIGRLAMDYLQSLINQNECGVPKVENQIAVLVRGCWQSGSTVRAPHC